MKSIRILGACALLGTVAVLPSVSSTHAAPARGTFSSKNCAYSAAVPSGWTVKAVTNGDEFSGASSNVKVTCTKDKSGISADAYLTQLKNALIKGGNKVTVYKKITGNHSALRTNNGKYWVQIDVTINKGDLFTFQYVAPSVAKFNADLSTYDALRGSVKFR